MDALTRKSSLGISDSWRVTQSAAPVTGPATGDCQKTVEGQQLAVVLETKLAPAAPPLGGVSTKGNLRFNKMQTILHSTAQEVEAQILADINSSACVEKGLPG